MHRQVTNKPLFLWFLNDELDPQELRSQIREMERQGAGGFFMHWITGSEPYMSERWLRGLETTIQEAAKRSLEAWLYDEAWCPSCFAGGRILTKKPELQLQTIHSDIRNVSAGERVCVDFDLMEVLGVFALPIRSGVPDLTGAVRLDDHLGTVSVGLKAPYRHQQGYYPHVKPLPHWRAASERRVWRLRWKAPPGSDWRIYVFCARRMWEWDRMNRLDVLRPESSSWFLRETHAVYADRFQQYFGSTIPGIMIDEPKFWSMPWTPALPEHFADRFGDDLVGSLPAIFDPAVKNGTPARANYHRLVSDLFHRNYIAPIADWCEEHDLILTGHISPEEDLSHETDYTGSIHRHLGRFGIPGTDLIIQAIGDAERPALNLGPKMAASVARQNQRARVFTEVGACCEEDVSLEEVKRLVDWHFVHGVNLIAFHGLAYALDGFRKFLAGQPFSTYNNMWCDFDLLAAHIESTSAFLCRHPRVPRIAVLKPHTASRALSTPYDQQTLDARERIDESLISLTWTLLANHIDFDLLDEDTAGGWESGGGKLTVGAADYELIIIPECAFLSAPCADALDAFAENDGTLLTIGAAPSVLGADGNGSRHLSKTILTPECTSVPALATEQVGRDFALQGEGAHQVLAYHGEDPEGKPGFFLLNTGKHKAEISLRCGEHQRELGLEAGASRAVDFASHAGSVPKVSTSRGPLIPLDGPWQVRARQENHVPIRGRKTLLDVQEGASIRKIICDLSEWEQVSENLTINGEPVERCAREESFYDVANKVVPVAGRFHPGQNVVRLDTDEFLTVLLAGRFGVFADSEGTWTVEEEVSTSPKVSRLACGYPWLRGPLTFTTEFTAGEGFSDGARLHLPGRRGSVTVQVDGRKVGTVAWRPNSLDLGPLGAGKHRLQLDVVGDGIGVLRGKANEAGSAKAPYITGHEATASG